MKIDDSELEKETFWQRNGAMIFLSLFGVILVSVPYIFLINRALPYSKNLHITFETNDVIKPFSDKRSYKYIQLSNFVDTLLIHDPDATTGGASLSIGVGSSHEPKELPGLAHLLEHMMFLGSNKYPKFSEFDDFISQNGGATNAFTGDTSTTYFFAVNDHSLEKGLDLFSNCFISPLLAEEMIEKELSSVNSEYEMDLTREGWRFHELIRRLANKDHSFSRFSIGNFKSLKETPKLSSYNLTAKLKEFFNENYSSHKMSLVIVSSHSVEKMEKWASEKFSQIKFKQVSVDHTNINKNIEAFPSENLKKIVFFKPIGHDQTLSIIFPINSKIHKDYLAKSVDFVTDSLSSTKKGSLYRILKEKGFINDLNIHYAQKYSDFGLMTISAYLTEDGIENYQEVLKIIYSGINLVKEKGINEERYKTLSILSYLNFMYQPKKQIQESLIEFVMKVSSMPIHHLLVGWEVYMNYQPELIKNVTEQLNPNNSIVLIGSDHFNVNITQRLKEKRSREEKKGIHRLSIEELTIAKNELWAEEETFQNGFEPISTIIQEHCDNFGAWSGSFKNMLKMNFEDGNQDLLSESDYYFSQKKTPKGIWKDFILKGYSFTKIFDKRKNLKSTILGEQPLEAEAVKEAWELTKNANNSPATSRFRFSEKLLGSSTINTTLLEKSTIADLKEMQDSQSFLKINLDKTSQKRHKKFRFSVKKKNFSLQKNLTIFDEAMKFPFLVENMTLELISKLENANYSNLSISNFSSFIPDSLAIESNCRKNLKGKDQNKTLFKSNRISKSDFSGLINDLIESKWDNLKEAQAHELDKNCLINEIKADNEAFTPNLILNNSNTSVWLFPDRSDMSPILYARLKLQSVEPLKSDKEILAKKFLNIVLKQKIIEDLEDARASGYRINFLLQEESVQLKISGWTDKFAKALRECFNLF